MIVDDGAVTALKMTRRRGFHDEKVAMMGGLDLFGECTPDEVGRLATISTEVPVAVGEVMCCQGGFESEFFVIVDGYADVDVDGVRVATLRRGDFFGEQALLVNGARNASVTAISPMTVLVLNRGEFEAMLVDAPHAAAAMLREISNRAKPASE